MSEEQYHSASHCKYLIQYHIIWCPKFRFSVLKGNVEETLKQILQKICANFASSVCVFRLNRCEHIASPVYGYGSSV